MAEDQFNDSEDQPDVAAPAPSSPKAVSLDGAREEAVQEPGAETEDVHDLPRAAASDEFIAALAMRITQHSGPLPHPEILTAYERAVAGSGDRIIKMAEETAKHRRQINRREMSFQSRALELNGRESLLGQIFAFTLAAIVLIGGIALLALGKDLAGLGAIITAAVSLVSVFIAGKLIAQPGSPKSSRKNEKDEGNGRETPAATTKTDFAQSSHESAKTTENWRTPA